MEKIARGKNVRGWGPSSTWWVNGGNGIDKCAGETEREGRMKLGWNGGIRLATSYHHFGQRERWGHENAKGVDVNILYYRESNQPWMVSSSFLNDLPVATFITYSPIFCQQLYSIAPHPIHFPSINSFSSPPTNYHRPLAPNHRHLLLQPNQLLLI